MVEATGITELLRVWVLAETLLQSQVQRSLFSRSSSSSTASSTRSLGEAEPAGTVVVTAAVATISAIATAVVFHQIDFLGSRGLTPTEAAANFIPQTVATLIATLGIGALADRFSPRVVLATSMVMLAGGLALGTAVTPGFVAISFGMLIGASGGAMRVVEATELPRYFGTLHIGAIRGVVTSVGIAGAAVGPLAFSLIHDITGDYTTVLVVSIIVPAAVMVATFTVRLPEHSEPDASGESRVVHKA